MGEAIITRRSASKSLIIPPEEAPEINFSMNNSYYLHCGFKPRFISIYAKNKSRTTGYHDPVGALLEVVINFDLNRVERIQFYGYNQNITPNQCYFKTSDNGNNYLEVQGYSGAGDYYDLFFKIYQRSSGIEFEAHRPVYSYNGGKETTFTFIEPCIVAAG